MNRKFPKWLALIILVVVNVEVYLPIINQDFANWDDPKHIEAIWEPGWAKAFRISTDWDLTYTRVKYFSPLHFLSLMMDQALILPSPAPQPWISKAFNVFFHILNALLVFSLLTSVGITNRAALIGALLFSIHPIQVASVAWISERKNLLMALFYLLSFTCFLKYLRTRSSMTLPLFLIFYVAGLLSKPQIVGLPLVAAAWALMMRNAPSAAPLESSCSSRLATTALGSAGALAQRPEGRKTGEDYGIYCILALLTLISIVWGLYVMSTEVSVEGVLPPAPYRPFLAAAAICFYIYKIVLPFNLVPVYPRWDVVGDIWIFVLLFVVVVGFSAVFWRFRKRIDPLIKFGGLFFIVNILLVCGLVPFGFMSHAYVADHFVYLPMIGLSIILGRSIDLIARSTSESSYKWRLINASFYLLICVLGVLAIKQTLLWQNPISLWEANLKVNDRSPAVYSNYGGALADRGEFDKAMTAFRKAVDLAPTLDMVYANMGIVYFRRNKMDDARKMFETALGLNPNEPGYYIRLAGALKRLNRDSDALDLLEIGSDRIPNSPGLFNELGLFYVYLHRPDDAKKAFAASMRLDPFSTEARANLPRSSCLQVTTKLRRSCWSNRFFMGHIRLCTWRSG